MATGATYTININAQQGLAALKQLQGGFQGLSTQLNGMPGGRVFSGITAGAVAATAAVAALSAALVRGLSVNSEIETARLGIKSLVLALTEVRDATGRTAVGEEQIQLAGEIADEQVRKLRLAGLQTAATFQQLLGAFQQGIGAGSSAGLGLDQIRELTVGIVQAAGAIGVPMEQLNQEVRSLLAGDISADSTVAKALGITNAQVKEWQRAGTMAAELNKRLEAFKRLGPEASQTWTATLSNMSDAVGMFLGSMSEGAFTRLKTALQGAFSGLFDQTTGNISAQFEGLQTVGTAVFTAIGDTLAAAIEGGVALAQELSAWFSENQVTLAQWGDALGAAWDTIKSILGAAAQLVGSIVRWGSESGAFTTVLQGAALLIAGIHDGIRRWSAILAIVGASISDYIGKPLRQVANFIADLLARIPGVGKAAAEAVRSLAQRIPENGDGLRSYARGVAEDMRSGNTEFARTLASLRTAQQIREDQSEQLREARRGQTGSGTRRTGTSTPRRTQSDDKEGQRAAEQLRTSLQQLADARLAAAKTVSESERKIEEAALDQKLAEQLITYKAFLEKKAALEKAALDDQIAAATLAQQQIEANLSAEKDPAKKNRLLGDLEKAKANLTALRNNKLVIDTKLEIDKVQFARDVAGLRVDITANLLDAKGNTLEASLARLAQETDNLLRDKRVAGNPELEALVRQQSDSKGKSLRFDDEQNQFRRKAQELADYERQLQNQVALGTLTQTEAEQKLNAERKASLETLKRTVDAAEQLALATGNPEQLAAIRQFRLEMQGVEVQTNAATAAMRDGFVSALKTAFNDLTRKGAKLKDVLRELAIAGLSRISDRYLDQAFDSMLAGTRKGGGPDAMTGYFSQLGTDAGGSFISAIQSGWSVVKNLFSGLADLLKGALQGLGNMFSSSSGGSGGGGWAGLAQGVASLFGYADGGYIARGPGTERSDSILARLSRGEFVVNAAAVRRVGVGALHHINSLGRLPGFASGGGWGLPAMSAGGGSTTVNANISPRVMIAASDVVAALKQDPEFGRYVLAHVGENGKSVRSAWGT